MNQKHGYSGTSEHAAWRNMIRRCTNPKCKSWKHYGGRGIKVCERWKLNFLDFLKDIGMKPEPLMTLERIDTEEDYKPGNVKWATTREQGQNKRRSEITGRSLYCCSICGQPLHNSQTCPNK